MTIGEGVEAVYEIRSNIWTACPVCGEGIGSAVDGDDTEERVNHFLQQHPCRLLHVGQETTRDDEGNFWHLTVYVLGCSSGS